MIEIVKTINGVKKLVPLTTDSGQGLPLGAITAFYGTTPPNGYLLCDGSEFSSTDYPALYTFLGDNHTPDLRECVLVGVGQNSTDSIATHDVYTLGEFKDDQLQTHTHSAGNGSQTTFWGQGPMASTTTPPGTTGNPSGRKGDTTHGKQKGVNYIIKAVIGPIEDNAADQVVQNVNNSRSYSTEEVNTGKTWIDGKPIYRKTYYLIIATADQDFNHYISNLGLVTKIEGFLVISGGITLPFNFYAAATAYFSGFVDSTKLNIRTVSGYTNSNAYLTLEYTKTTD